MAFVHEALSSVIGQTREPDEIVIVDDGSTDGTLDVVRGFADPRVRVVELPHRGLPHLGETYNAGLSATTGDLVSLIEGDDRWLPWKLDLHEQAFADPSVDVAHGTYAVIGARGTVLRDHVAPHLELREGPYDALVAHLLFSYVMPVTATLRRSALMAIGGFRQVGNTPHVDYATFLPLAERGRFSYGARPVAEWRKHGGSGTSQLAGHDLEAATLCRNLALETRARLARTELPSVGRIEQAWDDAHGRTIWNMTRILLRRHRYPEARAALAHAGGRRYSGGMRARLLLANLAAHTHLDLERIAAIVTGRSAFEQLD